MPKQQIICGFSAVSPVHNLMVLVEVYRNAVDEVIYVYNSTDQGRSEIVFGRTLVAYAGAMKSIYDAWQTFEERGWQMRLLRSI